MFKKGLLYKLFCLNQARKSIEEYQANLAAAQKAIAERQGE